VNVTGMDVACYKNAPTDKQRGQTVIGNISFSGRK